ncbi:polyprenyl synthetase family protein [Pseudohalioglobus lutimaris]|uniref:Octaprenyl diphosphate synthase n=1 Tax=Pseudohalioglobus lutimaris TaxID=1737061 RepID=A0A2N5WZC2_9GAMM|nr:polyprenyl synthetase family protein [Pseudohalioglobus lutimaris]PLW67573.1 octaprenyl diphosphate synthase [Pseudohalioglobus lutimaris]
MQDIRSAVAAEFQQVNELIIDQLHSDVDMVENIGHYIVDAGGKRLRPLLVLLTAASLDSCHAQAIKFAAVIEFIHTATLLHDDVVDISSLRRGRPTANAEFGNAPSVLVGDFLYTRAFQLMVQLGDMDILRHMADTTNTIAEGEVLQLVRAGDAKTTQAQYLDVITRKTAILFAAGCYGAATLCGVDERTRQNMHDFGLNLGIAFQMIDDVLDYEGDPAAMGKNVGDDLNEGKPTLPLIYTLQNGNKEEQALITRAITEKTADDIADVLAAVQRCGALDYTRQRAQHYHDQAMVVLEGLPAGPARDALAQITALSIHRDH